MRRAIDLALGFCLLALGCSALVEPREGAPRCEVGESASQVCPQGLECRDGRCQRSCRTDVPDVCGDNLDNDCDGEIDEIDSLGRDTCGDGMDNDCDGEIDEGSDGDRDGFSWCGNTASVDGGRGQIDCDDSIVSVNPGASEVCDGRDNDCDGIIDDPSGDQPLCPDGQFCFNQRCVASSCASEASLECSVDERCDEISGQCVPRACDPACAPTEMCDVASGSCKPRQRQPNGATCSSPGDCLSDSCIDAAALRFASGTRVCGQACCSDDQCGSGERCFASGTGARSCLPARLVPPSAPRECTTNDHCNSGELCGLSREQSLAPPTYIDRDDIIVSSCTTTPFALGVGERCTFYTDCATRVCVPGFPFGSLCSNPCGSTNDCRQLAAAARLTGGLGAYCRFVDVTLDNAPPDYASVCVVQRIGEAGFGEYGAPCSTDRDCQEGGCVEATSTKKGRCTSTCCHDSQCGPREDGEPILCRPFAFGDRYEMRCDL